MLDKSFKEELCHLL